MGFVNEPLAELLPEYIVTKNGKPWELYRTFFSIHKTVALAGLTC